MNLVAKEGPVVNNRDGVLVLSQSSGAHSQLSGAAISVAPTDISGTSEALYRAITMSAAERKERAATLYRSICRHDNDDWLSRQMEDVAALL